MSMSEHGHKGGAPEEEPVIRSDSLTALYPGRFLRAEDLHGKEVTIKIVDLYGQRLEGKDAAKKQKTILVFERSTPGPREIVLAKINACAIKGMWGDKIQDIVGKRITIYGTNRLLPMMVGENKGKICIRIKGSPDIDRPIPVTFVVPRRRPVEMVMQPTGKGKSPAESKVDEMPPADPRDPNPDADRDAYDNRDPEAGR
jgi:hypothetical protein